MDTRQIAVLGFRTIGVQLPAPGARASEALEFVKRRGCPMIYLRSKSSSLSIVLEPTREAPVYVNA